MTVSFVPLRAQGSPAVTSPGARLARRDERLAFLDDVRGELRRVAAADVLRRVDRPGGDEQGLAGLEPHRRRAPEPGTQQASGDGGELFPRMAVPGGARPVGEVARP